MYVQFEVILSVVDRPGLLAELVTCFQDAWLVEPTGMVGFDPDRVGLKDRET